MNSKVLETPDELLAQLATAARLTILTGAGMSAESGVPTFRDAQTGLWARYSPEELATPAAFAAHPQRVWQWYQWRRSLVEKAAPHTGHRALAGLQERFPAFSLITQNVDGLHQRAGNHDVIEFHGSLQQDRCSRCDHEQAADTTLGHPPCCPTCGSTCRPAVVWFGETIPPTALESACHACDTDLMLVIGTAGAVHPAAGLVQRARDQGATIAVINTEASALDSFADICWRAPASALDLLLSFD